MENEVVNIKLGELMELLKLKIRVELLTDRLNQRHYWDAEDIAAALGITLPEKKEED